MVADIDGPRQGFQGPLIGGIMTEGVGKHLLIEMYDCDERMLNDPEVIESAMLCAARCCGTTIIHHYFHRFSPHGVSGIIVIAESHMSIHTWPEYRYAAVDLFTCGNNTLSEPCLGCLREALRCQSLVLKTIPRGVGVAAEVPSYVRAAERPLPDCAASAAEEYQPLHPEIFRYDADFVTRFIAPEVAAPRAADVKQIVREMAEQIYVFQLFTPEFCRLLIEEAEHRDGWVTILQKTEEAHSTMDGVADLIEPDTTLSWELLPGMPEVYARVIENHVQPLVETLWRTFKLQKWDAPAVRKFEPQVVSGMDLHYDNEIVGMIGYLNTGFEDGGTFFPRWNLTIGRSGDLAPGSVAVYPGGVSHEHLALRITAGTRYMLANSFY
jgi:S-adenosylmethionine decarboxylase